MLADLTRHLTTHAEEGHVAPVTNSKLSGFKLR